MIICIQFNVAKEKLSVIVSYYQDLNDCARRAGVNWIARKVDKMNYKHQKWISHMHFSNNWHPYVLYCIKFFDYLKRAFWKKLRPQIIWKTFKMIMNDGNHNTLINYIRFNCTQEKLPVIVSYYQDFINCARLSDLNRA